MALYRLDDRTPVLPGPDQFWVADSAKVIGDVHLAEDVGIWFGSVLRGDNEPIMIGRGTNIQEHSILHTDMGFPLTIGERCTVGHRATLHGCTIGNDSLIGMGATVLNGAKIGENCLIGANALVPENKVIPDNSLVMGMPGKVVRETDEAMRQMISDIAKGYMANWRRFAAGMIRLS